MNRRIASLFSASCPSAKGWLSCAVLACALGLLGACSSGGADAKSAADAKSEKAPRSAASNADGTSEGSDDSDPESRLKANRPSMNAAAKRAYEAGVKAFQSGDLVGAEQQFNAAIKADSKAYLAHHAAGTVLERNGKNEAAIKAYRQALSVVPDFERSIESVTSLLLRSERVEDAERFLTEQRALASDSAAVLAALAEVRSVQKDSAAAQLLAQKALKKNPDYRPAMVALARDHYRNRRLDLAAYTLTAILDGYGPDNPPRDKNNGEARLLRALIYKEQGQRRLAIDELKRVVELRPDSVEARLNLATFMLEAGNATEAVPLLETALRYDKQDVLAHLNLGDAYRLQGRPADAIKQLEWVASKDPTLAQAQYNLGLVYMFSAKVPNTTPEQGLDKAIAHFEQYKKLQPRTRPGAGDDADELIKRAKNKKAIMAAMNEDSFAEEDAGGGADAAAGGADAPAGETPAGEAPAEAAPADDGMEYDEFE